MTALSAPATLRNREPILDVLHEILPDGARVLEIASGTGEHALYFAKKMDDITWRPSDPDPQARASIAAWRAQEQDDVPNLLAPLLLDAHNPADWPPSDAIVCINMIHIAPWSATEGLMKGAENLPEGGVLTIYGPFIEKGVETAPSNARFDDSLKSRDPSWGLRDLEAVKALAADHGLAFAGRVAMPANNLMVWFVKA